MASSSAPATKDDVRMLMQAMGDYYDKMARKVDGYREEMIQHFEESKRHFDVVAEDIIHNFQGAFSDKIDQHEDRIKRLEHHTGIAA